MPRNTRLKLNQFVGDIVDSGSSVLTKATSLPPAEVRELMLAVAREICFRNAKSFIYVPEAKGLKNLLRNAVIWADYQRDSNRPGGAGKFTPARAQELAIEHDLSPQSIYNILKAAREGEHAPELQDADA